MFRTIPILLALLAGAALADGVPLITAGPPLAANDPLQQVGKGHPEFVKVHPITLNKNAFGANVLTVTVEGTEHRFVGGVVPQPPRPAGFVNVPPQPVFTTWRGTEPGGASITLSRGETGQISGGMFLPPGREFEVSSRALIEFNRALAPRPEGVTAPTLPTSGVKP